MQLTKELSSLLPYYLIKKKSQNIIKTEKSRKNNFMDFFFLHALYRAIFSLGRDIAVYLN